MPLRRTPPPGTPADDLIVIDSSKDGAVGGEVILDSQLVEGAVKNLRPRDNQHKVVIPPKSKSQSSKVSATGAIPRMGLFNNCKSCQRPDEALMAQCHECLAIHHFGCVALEDAPGPMWLCPTCHMDAKAKTLEKSNSHVSGHSRRSSASQYTRHSGSQSSRASQIERSMQKLDLLRKQEKIVKEQLEVLNDIDKASVASEKSHRRQFSSTMAKPNTIVADKTTPPKPPQNTSLSNNNTFEIQQSAHNSTSVVNNTLEMQQIQQLITRQSIRRDLPAFSGQLEEWPLFISSYEQSTKLCKFTNAENLSRLQFALRGPAREMVKSQLMLEASVPDIISTLKTIYGRPETLINAQIERVRKLPPLRDDKLENILEFSLAVTNLVASIKASQLANHLSNPTLVQEIVDKLPTSYKLQWASVRRLKPEEINEHGELVCLEKMLKEYMTDACSVMKPTVLEKTNKYTKAHVHSHSEVDFKVTQKPPSPKQATNIKTCVACRGICRNLSVCNEFLSMSYDERWELTKASKCCRSCLNRHRGKCDKEKKCGIDNCERFHNPLLHKPSTERNEASSSSNAKFVTNHHFNATPTLFRMIPVTIEYCGRTSETLALLDEGSSVSLMDKCLAENLQITGPSAPLHLHWTSNSSRTEEISISARVMIKGISKNAKRYAIDIRTVTNLNLPKQSMDYEQFASKYPEFRSLPVHSYTETSPQILLGLNCQKITIPRKFISTSSTNFVATRCSLGWAISGTFGIAAASHPIHAHSFNIHVCECSDSIDTDKRMDEMLSDYFKMDSIGISKNPLDLFTKDERAATKLMDEITEKRENRYVTGLLWKYPHIRIHNSRPMALNRLKCLERKLLQNPAMMKACQEQFNKYKNCNYIRKLQPNELNEHHQRVWYLPWFPVTNKNKPGKIRMVQDAAAVTHGVSLNSMLYSGPDINASLIDILIRFRERKVAINGDIEGMFHQVGIREEDQHALRFLWRDCDTTKEPEEWVMTVMIFGSTSSPYQAQYVKNKNAMEFAEKHPRAVEAIIYNHYVDDLLDSYDTASEAVETAHQIKDIHAAGGFNIRNWRSNSQTVLTALGETNKNEPVDMSIQPDDRTEKVLGMWWCTITDHFTYSLRFNSMYQWLSKENVRPTRRQLLITLMSIYDPLGLLANYLVGLKIILKEVCQSKVQWDDPIHDEQYIKWKEWVKQLPDIEKIKIQRCYLKDFTSYEDVNVTMHVFTDASENAMGATVYLRIQQGNEIRVSLVCAKTKNAPIKLTSIPRLELQAALIGARLAQTVKKALKIKVQRTYFWTDSKPVYFWIKSRNKRLNKFVAFRVSEIQEITNVDDWYWVPSDDNVADEATKIKHTDFSPTSRWLTGPRFLYCEPTEWPEPPAATEEVVMIHHEIEPQIPYSRFPHWFRLLRSVGFMIRFINKVKKQQVVPIKYRNILTSQELQIAHNYIIRCIQKEEYPEEYEMLLQNKQLTKENQLFKLSPMLNEQGLIVIRSRIVLCKAVNETMKYPIILPNNHEVTKKIILDEHERNGHMFSETVVNNIRQKYYIQHIRVTVKAVIKKCQHCKNKTATIVVPQESPLPEGRLDCYTLPFTHTGMDLFTTFNVTMNRRVHKMWGVIFTCLTSRAIHIELVDSLSTNACIMAIRNFMCRRGTPRKFYCDQGTNFIGTARVFNETLDDMDQAMIAAGVVTTDTEIVFNPPKGAHWGGAWERLIQSIKRALDAKLPHRNLTILELQSFLIEVENIINSRPLTYIPIDCEESEALTPNQLLLGSSTGAKPLGPLDDSTKQFKFTWLNIQLITQQFWSRWVKEYLPDLVRRSKWFDDTEDIKEGDIVIIIDPEQPRNTWPRGKVIETLVSKDGKVRRAIVQTATATVTKPTSKLARLKVETSFNEYERPVTRLARLSVRSEVDTKVNGGECHDEAQLTGSV